MTNAAAIVCYIQPVKTFCAGAGVAWLDTEKTAVVRREVCDKAEAVSVIEEAKCIAEAIGGKMVVKVLANKVCGARRPAGVKSLQGNYIVGD